MSDMYDCGYHMFRGWSDPSTDKDGAIFTNREFHERYLGEYDCEMSGERAGELLNHSRYSTPEGHAAFVRGWERSKQDLKAGILHGVDGDK